MIILSSLAIFVVGQKSNRSVMNKRKLGARGFSGYTQSGGDGDGGTGGWMRRPENIWNDGPSVRKVTDSTKGPREGRREVVNTTPIKNYFSATSNLEKSLDRELTDLDREYEGKLSSLETWKTEEVKRIVGKYGRKRNGIADREGERNGNPESSSSDDSEPVADYFDYETNQFDVENGGTACSSISIVAVYNFLRPRKAKCDITTIKWDSVVKHGADLWCKWWNGPKRGGGGGGGGGNIERTSYQTVIEAYEMKNIKTLRETISVTEEIGGHLDDSKVSRWRRPVFAPDPNNNSSTDRRPTEEELRQPSDQISFYSLLEAVRKLKRGGEDRAATLTIRNATVSMFYDRENFWVFDSHGNPNREHRSALIKCPDEKNICRYLRKKYPLLSDEGRSVFVEETGGGGGGGDKDPNVFFIVIFSKVSPERTNHDGDGDGDGDDDDSTTDGGGE